MSSFFLHHTPFWLPLVFPKFIWYKSTKEKVIYLTFDDGPVPEATPQVLDCLREFGALATFFCVGENIEKNPEVFHRVLNEGHRVGNHTYHHLNGWKASSEEFLDDVARCQNLLNPYRQSSNKPLMRPPYGRLKKKQWQALLEQYEIVMWDVLSGDFSNKVDAGVCLKKSIRHTRSGSIVLFHDSVKTIDKLILVLPGFLRHFTQLGYWFLPL